MAKVGKPKMYIPDEFFTTILEKMRPDLQAEAEGIARAAESKANAVRKPGSQPIRAKVEMTTNRQGRPTALVMLQHPAALALQAKYGVVTMAAAERGFEVRRFKG